MDKDIPLDAMGSSREIPIGGKTYTMSPINIGGIKTIKSRIRSSWLDNLTASNIDSRAHQSLRATLLSKPIPMDVVYEEMECPEMWPLILYLAIVPHDPSVTEEQFGAALDNMKPGDITALRDAMEQAMSSGVEQQGPDFTQNSSESTGPTPSPESCTSTRA